MSLVASLATVDFPHPDSPTTPNVSPGYNSKLTSSTARTLSLLFLKGIGLSRGKNFFSPFACKIGSFMNDRLLFVLTCYLLFGNDKRQNDFPQLLTSLVSFRDKYLVRTHNDQQTDNLVTPSLN